MFSSFFTSKSRRPSETTPLLAAIDRYRRRRNGQDSDRDDREPDAVAQYDGEDEDEDEGEGEGEDEDRQPDGPLLPVFSAEVLDRIPIYSTTHTIRILLVQRCETTLSWDQLRSPQVSQFLVKPIQQQLRSNQFSRGLLYCLLANCLQFKKEGEENPGNVGVSKTRALICELLAMRLLKEFSTRELIDALSYDFDPLQGLVTPRQGNATPGGTNWSRQAPRSARISSLEIAIRAQAKKFLAHPLVVRQLEAIWAGTIVFHSAADSLHRKPDSPQERHYHVPHHLSPRRGPSRRMSPTKPAPPLPPPAALLRRTVTLYDPHEASLFKLSRLRVPRYRNLFSTLSFAIMLGLFLAVLSEKSDDITALEVLFWFWSAGYMLDEVVGFSEQGFGLYIMSVWNAFDLGILLMFMAYYVLRLYGILMPDVSRSHVAAMAYDVLGSTAVLLFPRLFSALDHYRYFSQLLIAFKMMAVDLAAILVLIVISCSGFFVAFSLAFKRDFGASDAAYAIFQLVMGFSPAAWDLWGEMNFLGKTLLALFLFICHFLIVTILVTVLTNSFMAVVKNADEEHQFLFAVNTISMVKSDALFSYIPPTNIIGWLLIPLKYTMSFKKFLRMNRLVIKLTHLPILFIIFVYERLLLSHLAYGPTDLVEQRGRAESKAPVPAFSIRGPVDLFSPRLREPSVTTFQKDQALEEVFRRPFRDPSFQPTPRYPTPRRNSGNVVSDWMKKMGDDDENTPPQDDSRSVLDRLEGRNRPYLRRTKTAGQARRKHPLAATRTVVSNPDPDDVGTPLTGPIAEEEEPDLDMVAIQEAPQQTDADGDDEDDQETDPQVTPRIVSSLKEGKRPQTGYESSEDEFFRTPMTAIPRAQTRASGTVASPSESSFKAKESTSPSKRRSKPTHNRNTSTGTILFSPIKEATNPPRAPSPEKRPKTGNRSGTATGTATPGRLDTSSGTGARTPKRVQPPLGPPSRPRAIMPPRRNSANLLSKGHLAREPSFNAIALDLASDIGDNALNPNFANLDGLPASFTTQFEMAARMKAREMQKESDQDSDSNRMSRIMLARMTTLEEGFRDMLQEVKGLKQAESQTGSRGTHSPPSELVGKKKGKGKKKSIKEEDGSERMGSSL
ncbi:receptor-activated ca2+-permeable protein [Stemphylium lycopersici]|nr:receptor-activated ca2+-permeable protein [Stemphylium lycopersici]RAQ99916.1 receptor-activated ca2+-permeable protein [Stemphylium lycopersici]